MERLTLAAGATHILGMPTGFIAVAIGLGALALIVLISMRGWRDRGGRLPRTGGPMLPGPDWDDGGGDG